MTWVRNDWKPIGRREEFQKYPDNVNTTEHVIEPVYISIHSNSTNTNKTAGRYSSVGSDVAWESRGTAIIPGVRLIFS